MTTRWTPAEEDRAKECEAAFQNGYPKVRIYSNDGRPSRSWTGSAKSALFYHGDNHTIYARRKQGRQYLWMKAVVS